MRSEFGFLKDLKHHFNLARIGDDCAVIPKDATHDYLITSDMLVEDVDFRLSYMTPNLIGSKALTVSVSDIAAMAGRPCFSMLSIGIGIDLWKTGFLDEFYKSYQKKAQDLGVELIGGDLSQTSDRFVVDSTLIGVVPIGKAVLRSGAKPGDGIYVTGSLGGSAGGLKLLESGTRIDKSTPWQKRLIQRHLAPEPVDGLLLQDIASSMIDISDGLSSDLKNLCVASDVGAVLFGEKIPADPNLRFLTRNESETLELALHGGEDFELLFTANPTVIKQFSEFPCHHIGEITKNSEMFEIVLNGNATRLDTKGFEHFLPSS